MEAWLPKRLPGPQGFPRPCCCWTQAGGPVGQPRAERLNLEAQEAGSTEINGSELRPSYEIFKIKLYLTIFGSVF